ncbi:sigma-70 family RNA polymerase sigma factor [Actinophytocola oryzae]|uniref:RNA polymerase sigma factor (Sigma-70 family) n=1 Tax=Actinophytocola oryzae TaxID=502181 RepID=A0A4R7USD9_9PSEU|nr:sigma-70 family RNA polymerase sigma factor [Actinophytocola oryzae]TDV36854.1 RNA polymerase sigma factor (sigma-70 family) [Actinophytocola oryzae]
MATVRADVDGPNDAELIEAVRKGTVSAYGSLYERHVASAYNLARQLARSPAEADDLVSEAFAKVLDTLRGGRGPDSAFRAYLLTALRHTAYDRTRRERKVELSDDVSTVSGVSMAAVSEEFDDPAVAGLERSLAAQAFARLPERWQAVLWHTEVEGQSPAEVGPILGLTANGVSALAYRAREGLRQAYLQVHLAETSDRHCRAAADKLGAWTRGGLAKREKAQVEAHLDTCERCRALAGELADVNGAMRTFVAPVVLGAAAVGYLASAGAAPTAATIAGGVAGGVAGSAAGAAAAAPRQFLGLAASGMALAAAVVVGLTAGGAPPEIPAAAPTPTQQQQPPSPVAPPAPPQEPPREPAPQEPPATQQPEEPAPQTQAPPAQTPPPETPPPAAATPVMLHASGPNTPLSLVAGGPPGDLPVTVRNSGGTTSEPVTAALSLPPGVVALPVDGLAAPRLLSLDGARADTVNCPGGAVSVACSSEAGLAPGESVTLLFRLLALDGALGGPITGTVSAGSAMRVSLTVQVNVSPPEVTDGVQVRADADWTGLFGQWVRPVVNATVTNSGTSSRPVTVVLDRPARKLWSSQQLTCTTGDTTTCVTTAELAPGESLDIEWEVAVDWWLGRSPNRGQVHITATLGKATDSTTVTLWESLWPTKPDPTTPEPTPSTPPSAPPEKPSVPPSDTATTEPVEPPPSRSPEPPVTTTTPPRTQEPGPSSPPPTTTTPPPSSEPPTGVLGGLFGWLLGG